MPRPRLTGRLFTAVLSLTLLTAATAPATAAQGPPRAGRDPAGRCALPGRTGYTDEGHDTDPVQFRRPLGTLRLAMVFVDFPDAPATGPTGDVAAQLLPGANWLRDASYGKVRLAVTPARSWVRMPKPSTAYGFERGLSHEQHERYVRDAVRAADPYTDFSRYDMVYVVPPRNAPAISFSPAYLFDPAASGVVADGTRIKWAVTFGQDMWRWGPRLVGHETAHLFGLPDLYAFDGSDVHRYVGGWDVMGLVSGAAPHYSGWHAWKLGWLDDDQVACRATPGTDTVRLTPVEYRGGGTKAAVVRTSPTTAYVVESRRAVAADARACSTGVLVYRVDSATPTGHGPVRVQDARPDATPPAGCGQLDDAAYRAGQSFTDPASGVRVDVLDSRDGSDTVRITRR
ncbi:M6 family metalloprotease domain-containing protein [Streptomyces cinnamoneus]|uniref:M6 family metalloprotease domain-containing protein n=1 Tax=Streptomyces cinnamoneus TaxID=53446 RepID=UPI0037BBC7AF